MCTRPSSIIHPVPHIAQIVVFVQMGKWICLNCKIYLFIYGLHIWGGPLYYLSNAAHCSLLLLLPCVLVAYGLVSPGWPECSWPGRPSSPPSIWRTHPGATLLLLIQQLTPTGSACLVLFLPHALLTRWPSLKGRISQILLSFHRSIGS